MSSSLVSVYKINMITTKRNPVVGYKITCYYWHISCVACQSVCNGQSEMSVEPLNGGGGNIGWGAVWGESNSKSALSICLAWNQILLQKVAASSKFGFSPLIAAAALELILHSFDIGVRSLALLCAFAGWPSESWGGFANFGCWPLLFVLEMLFNLRLN